MKKIFSAFAFLLSFLLLAPQSAFADGTFTASNYSYNSTTKELKFDLANISGPIQFASGYVALVDPSISDTVGAATDGGANFSCDTSHCGVTFNYAFDVTFNPATNYMVSIYDSNNGYYSSQTINFSSPTPTPTPAIQIVADPSSANATVGTPFNVDVKVTDNSSAFNAAQANVAVSSNLRISGINNPSSNTCNLNYTKSPTTSDPSFAGATFGGSSTGCTVYTMTLIPTGVGTGTITFNNASVKAYSNSSEILTGVQNGSYSIANPTPSPTPPGTTLMTVDDSVQGTGQNQWNYVGSGWSHCTDSSNPACTPNLSNNSVSWDNTTNDYATVTFTGTHVALYGLVDPNHGIAGVSIDGGSETNVDFYSSTRAGNVLLWTSPLLTAEQHTLKVRVTGNKNSNSAGAWLALDRADILQTTPSGLTVSNSTLNTYGPTFLLTGTKDSSITDVFVNTSETGVTYPTSTTWQVTESVSLGNNNYVIYGKDANSVQTASINASVNMHHLGDINGDGVIDLADASLFAVDYGKTSNLTYPLSDMNTDGAADLTDLSILAKLE